MKWQPDEQGQAEVSRRRLHRSSRRPFSVKSLRASADRLTDTRTSHEESPRPVQLNLPVSLSIKRPNGRKVLECGGWRGTGLTPLSAGTDVRCWMFPFPKAVCALTPHPLAALSRRRSGPQSKMLAQQWKPSRYRAQMRNQETVEAS